MLTDFKALKITLASPQQILAWSHGEVKKAETINYRTMRAEPDGLMCEKIFGPTRDFECYCGKYKKIRYKGIICDKCGVEVTYKRVRRERMGHIKLSVPVVHIWYAHGTPNKLALMLDMQQSQLESVMYFAKHIVLSVDEEKRAITLEKADKIYQNKVEKLQSEKDREFKIIEREFEKASKELNKKDLQFIRLQSEQNRAVSTLNQTYKKIEDSYKEEHTRLVDLIKNLRVASTLSEDELYVFYDSKLSFFKTSIGAEAIRILLEGVSENLDVILKSLEKSKEKAKSAIVLKRIVERYRLLKSMKEAGVDPTWIILDNLPVLPPELRPIVALPGGRYATADVNDLYRRVINRNNRLRKLIEIEAPELILRNEKRMLQEAVDALIDNSHRSGTPVLNTKNQPYKSLSDTLRGKSGRFRQNILGKRVDYSGRAVIVGGPELKINQCGLPADMALELFRPYVIKEIIDRGYASNTKSAKTFFEEKHSEVYEILEKVIQGRPVLLNRAPTLHKQGVQAFFPVLISGNAIRLHPLVCHGFNADFDGDQMAVHVPLSAAAQKEAIEKMTPYSNVLWMKDGSPVISLEKDMAAGVYYLTSMNDGDAAKTYSSESQAIKDYDLKLLDLHEPIKALVKGKIETTTVGRILMNSFLPMDYPFVNKHMDKKNISDLSAKVFIKYGPEATLDFYDNVQKLSFKVLTQSGVSVAINDYRLLEGKDNMIAKAKAEEDKLNELYEQGLVGDAEKPKLSQKIWMDVTQKIGEATVKLYETKENPLNLIDKSGSVPTKEPYKSSAGMKGLILDLSGKIVELPITSNYIEGYNSFEYFVAARGSRKGEADKGLMSAKSGYLTRKLCQSAQDLITMGDDCGTSHGIDVHRMSSRRLSFEKRIAGRVAQIDIKNPTTGELIISKGEMIDAITSEIIGKIQEIDKVFVRSVLTCDNVDGVCTKCYGADPSTQKLVKQGIAVGIIAGQAMGESSLQLTMDSKHTGAKAGTSTITKGLPRLTELFEIRTPNSKAIIAEIAGNVQIIIDEKTDTKKLRISSEEDMTKEYTMKEGDELLFTRSKKVKKGEGIVRFGSDGGILVAPIDGQVEKLEGKVKFSGKKYSEVEYDCTKDVVLRVKDGDVVASGQQISEGSVDAKELMKFGDLHTAERYLVDNIQDVFGIQGISMDDRHIEMIVRKMGGYVQIVESGDSFYIPGDIISFHEVRLNNIKLKEDGKSPAKFIRKLLGITQATLKNQSFLSAAAFQEQVRILTEHSLRGSVDHLKDLITNVIIGRKVPLDDIATVPEEIETAEEISPEIVN